MRILLNSHAHSDHAGGLKELQDASGAALWVSAGDAAVMAAGGKGDPALGIARHLWHLGALRFDAPRIDRIFTDGQVVRLGPTEVTAHLTPGHTRGCTSWSFMVEVEDESLLAVNICSLTLFPFVSLDPEAYPGINADWQRSFEVLRVLPADIFLGSHTAWFGMNAKRGRQLEAGGSAAPFVDPEGYQSFVDQAEQTYLDRSAPDE